MNKSMTLSELYEAVGGDYANVRERLGGEQTVRYFVLRYLDDPSYQELLRLAGEQDRKKLFYAAHTLKGVAQSLGFSRLGASAGALCEDLRRGIWPAEDRLRLVETEQQAVIEAIRAWHGAE